MKIQQRDKPKKLKPSRDLQAKDGWLTPEGYFYPCKPWQHNIILVILGKKVVTFLSCNAEARVELLGWLKLQESRWLSVDYDRPITQSQLDFIFDWCQVHNKELPSYLKT